MSKAEIVFGLGVLAFGAFLLEEALKLAYFVEEVPGPGFVPFWLALAIIGIGLALVVRAARSSTLASRRRWPDASGRWRIGVVFVVLFLSLTLLEPLGFLAVSVLFVAIVAFGLGIRSWKILVPVPLLSAIVLYGVFAVWLRVPLPRGILSFLG